MPPPNNKPNAGGPDPDPGPEPIPTEPAPAPDQPEVIVVKRGLFYRTLKAIADGIHTAVTGTANAVKSAAVGVARTAKRLWKSPKGKLILSLVGVILTLRASSIGMGMIIYGAYMGSLLTPAIGLLIFVAAFVWLIYSVETFFDVTGIFPKAKLREANLARAAG